MTVRLELDFAQVKKLVDNLPRKEKHALARHLDEQTLFDEIRAVQNELKNSPISSDQITAEVEKVRKARANRAHRR